MRMQIMQCSNNGGGKRCGIKATVKLPVSLINPLSCCYSFSVLHIAVLPFMLVHKAIYVLYNRKAAVYYRRLSGILSSSEFLVISEQNCINNLQET